MNNNLEKKVLQQEEEIAKLKKQLAEWTSWAIKRLEEQQKQENAYRPETDVDQGRYQKAAYWSDLGCPEGQLKDGYTLGLEEGFQEGAIEMYKKLIKQLDTLSNSPGLLFSDIKAKLTELDPEF